MVRGGRGHSPPYDVCRSEACQPRRVCTYEERTRLVVLDPTLAHQRFQRFDEIVRHRYDPLLAPLTAQEHLRPPPIELKVARVDAQCFGNACAGAGEEKQQCSISATARSSLIWRVNE